MKSHFKNNVDYIPIRIFLLLFILSIVITSLSDEICKISYKDKPEDLHDSTIIVPEEVVAQSEYIHVPISVDFVPIILYRTIFFIIDHSSSMYTNSGKDVWGSRFRITCDIIDSLKNRFPKSEIGISVFTEYLYFRPENDPHGRIVQCTGIDSGGYIPLFQLDSSYAPTGEMGWQILQGWLETDTVIETIAAQTVEFVDLKYRPVPLWDDWQGGSNSNINVGFEAAKHAMQSSKYPKHRQYIIFITDGEVSPASNPTDFVQGVNTPTTFTIFFVEPGGSPPQLLLDMNVNIQNNGYSVSNPMSQLWEFQDSSYEALIQYLLGKVVDIITHSRTSYPIQMRVNGIINNPNPWDTVGMGFDFDRLFPLTGQITSFVYDIDYKIWWIDSITPVGDTIWAYKDTSTHIEFNVAIQDSAPDLPNTFEVKRWDRTLGLYYNGESLDQVNKTMDTLEIRFTEKEIDILYDYDSITVTITNSEGDKDSEALDLTKTDSCFTKLFTIAIDSTPAQNDGILQVFERDTIIAIFRNPILPLDTLKITVPFNPTTAIDPNTVFSNGKFSFIITKTGSMQNILRVYNLPRNGNVSLYAINGRKVFEQSLYRGNASILLPNTLSRAVYLISLKYGDTVLRKKLLLK